MLGAVWIANDDPEWANRYGTQLPLAPLAPKKKSSDAPRNELRVFAPSAADEVDETK